MTRALFSTTALALVFTTSGAMADVTPEEVWLKGDGREWFMRVVSDTCDKFGHLLDREKTLAHIQAIADGKAPFSFVPWRLVCLGKWHNSVK